MTKLSKKMRSGGKMSEWVKKERRSRANDWNLEVRQWDSTTATIMIKVVRLLFDNVLYVMGGWKHRASSKNVNQWPIEELFVPHPLLVLWSEEWSLVVSLLWPPLVLVWEVWAPLVSPMICWISEPFYREESPSLTGHREHRPPPPGHRVHCVLMEYTILTGFKGYRPSKVIEYTVSSWSTPYSPVLKITAPPKS
jgi:hypothetical protein